MLKIRSFLSIINSIKESKEEKIRKNIQNINSAIYNEKTAKETTSNIFFEEIDLNLKIILKTSQEFFEIIKNRLKNYLEVVNNSKNKNKDFDEESIYKIEEIISNYDNIIKEKDSIIQNLEKELKFKENDFFEERKIINLKIEELKKEINFSNNIKIHEKENLELKFEEKSLNILELNKKVKMLKYELEEKNKKKSAEPKTDEINLKKLIEKMNSQYEMIQKLNKDISSSKIKSENKSDTLEEKIGKYKEKLKNHKEKAKILEEVK